MSPRVADGVRLEEKADQYADVIGTILDADQPPTKRDIELETLRSSSQIKRILNELCERDCIRPVRDDDDRRVIRYEIVLRGTDR